MARTITQDKIEILKERSKDLLENNMYDIPGLNDTRSQYVPEEKLMSAMGWVLTGSAEGASRISGVPAYTIRKWKSDNHWWQFAIEECKKVAYEALDYRFGTIIEDVMAKLETRLRDGDKIVTKSGIQTQPIRARDLVQILSTVFDKRQLVRGDVTSRTEKVDPTERLKNLRAIAEDFGKDIKQDIVKGATVESLENYRRSKNGDGH